MADPDSWWEQEENARWRANNPEPEVIPGEAGAAAMPATEEKPLIGVPMPPEKGTFRHRRFQIEWFLIDLLSFWALLNALDMGPSIYRFYQIDGNQFLTLAVFSSLCAYLGSRNRWDPLAWWSLAFFAPPVTLCYLVFYSHLRKTRTMWRRNDIIFALSCAIFIFSSNQIESIPVRAVIYSCCLIGALTAAIAEEKARDPLVWWAFGFLLPPVALPCAILFLPADKALLAESERKVCPVCGEILPASERTCGFCGHGFR